MELYDKFNDKFCEINEHLGDVYSYKDLEDLEKIKKDDEINLLRQAIKKQQMKINRTIKHLYEQQEINVKYIGHRMSVIQDIIDLLEGE